MSSSAVRIARIITRLNIGGPSIQAISLSRDLIQFGFHTCLIHGHLGQHEGSMTDLLPLQSAPVVYLDDLQRPVSPLKDVRAFWRLYLTLRRWQPDIVHTHMAKAGALGRFAAIAYNLTSIGARPTRLIHTYHGHVFDGHFGPWSTRLFLFVERFLAKRTDALIAISDAVRKDLVDTYAIARHEQLRLIPLGFNLEKLRVLIPADRARARQRLQIAEDAIVVTTVGRLTAIKQQQFFLSMAERLVRRDQRFLFVIAGDGELRERLTSQARKLGIDSHTRFLGWRGDLETIYAATDVFVLTSRHEGTPVVIIEAMAAGVPCVSTDVGGVRDVITGPDVGLLVPFGDVCALVDAVASLAADEPRRHMMGEQARRSVEHRFAEKRLVDDITRLYWQLLGVGGTIR